MSRDVAGGRAARGARDLTAQRQGSEGTGVERRAHERVAVDVRARIERDGRHGRTARILDFCPGGLFLQVDGQDDDFLVIAARQVARGDVLQVVFQASDDAGESRSFAVPVSVARLFGGGMGVAFSPPHPEALRALQRVADRVRARGASAARRTPGEGALSPEDAASAIKAVRQRLERWLREELDELFKRACDDLFVEARDAQNNEIQNECMDAMKDVERVAPTVRAACLDGVLRALDRVSPDAGGAGEASRRAGEVHGDDLALVDTGSFDDWVTTKNIISRHEPKLKDPAYALSRRLSVITGRSIDELANPAGLQSIATAFNESMQNLGLLRRAREAIYNAFEAKLVAHLESLYERLNAMLVERGVLPKVERPVPHTVRRPHAAPAPRPAPPPERPPEPPPAPNPAHLESGRFDAQSWNLDSARFASPPPMAPPGAAAPSSEQAGGAPWPSQAPPAPPTEATPGWRADAAPAPPGPQAPAGEAAAAPYQPHYQSPIQPAVPQVGMARAYQAARSLMGLHQAVRTGGPVTAAPVPAAPPGAGAVSPQVLGALDSLQGSEEFNAPRPRQRLQLKERLHAALARDGLDLSPQENEVVDVLTALIEAVLGDPLIEQNVKPRIHRLSVPMLKVALQDQGFFMEDAHPARQVVNRLGMLGLPEDGASGEEGDSLRAAVDPLLDRIIAQRNLGPQAFEDVLPELDAIVQRQAERYGRNVEGIVETRERQQAMLAGRRGAEHAGTRRVAAELQPWFKRTQRLKAGDVVTFNAGTDNPEPRTLAWVSDDHETFVFTDRSGRHAGSLAQQELALEMLRGSARVLDSADVPAMDRGVYEMLHRIHRALAEEGQRDSVTGLMPLGAFESRVDEAIGRAQRRGSKHALLALDLDGFATINEKCGRKAGDSLLRKLARLLDRQVGNQGCVTRTHADEFLMLLEDHAFPEARRFAERQVRAIENSRVVFEGEQYPITVSVGLVPVTRAGESADVMIERARAALGGARRRGGNQLRIFHPDEDQVSDEAAADAGADEVAGLGALLDAGRLVLRRQPVTGLVDDGDVKPHFEVLLGMRTADGGIEHVTRDLVVEAERDGRMVDVDRWMVQRTLEWMAANRREIIKSGGYAINLSGATLAEDGLLDFVVEQLTSSSVPPAKVVFEVTESVAIDRLSSAVGFIRTLREYGCRFSIDDFGAGHATFSYLKTLPVDFVKIDGMFVRDLADNDADYAMVKSINEIAHLLGKQTIAESADSEEVIARLRELEVDFAQGSAVAAPEPME